MDPNFIQAFSHLKWVLLGRSDEVLISQEGLERQTLWSPKGQLITSAEASAVLEPHVPLPTALAHRVFSQPLSRTPSV